MLLNKNVSLGLTVIVICIPPLEGGRNLHNNIGQLNADSAECAHHYHHSLTLTLMLLEYFIYFGKSH